MESKEIITEIVSMFSLTGLGYSIYLLLSNAIQINLAAFFSAIARNIRFMSMDSYYKLVPIALQTISFGHFAHLLMDTFIAFGISFFTILFCVGNFYFLEYNIEFGEAKFHSKIQKIVFDCIKYIFLLLLLIPCFLESKNQILEFKSSGNWDLTKSLECFFSFFGIVFPDLLKFIFKGIKPKK